MPLRQIDSMAGTPSHMIQAVLRVTPIMCQSLGEQSKNNKHLEYFTKRKVIFVNLFTEKTSPFSYLASLIAVYNRIHLPIDVGSYG